MQGMSSVQMQTRGDEQERLPVREAEQLVQNPLPPRRTKRPAKRRHRSLR